MSVPGEVGTYRGVKWHRKRICDVLPALDSRPRARWYFPLEDGEYTGDHFRTKGELFAGIDAMLAARNEQPTA